MIELRPAVPADLPDIAALAARCFADAWSEALFRQELDPPEKGAVWVATRERQIVGYAVLRRVLDELHVLSLAVAPEQRRGGVASELLGTALSEEPGARVLHLEVRAGNEVARRFYSARGFVAVGLRSRYYDDGEDAVLMSRIMTPEREAAGPLPSSSSSSGRTCGR